MRIGKAKARFDIVIRRWEKSKVVEQKVISPIYNTSCEDLKNLIKDFLTKLK